MVPNGEMQPILLPSASVNQRLPSGPAAMLLGLLDEVGSESSVMTPDSVLRPILLPSASVNQMLPSGPAMINHAYAGGRGAQQTREIHAALSSDGIRLTAKGALRPCR